MSHWSGCIRTMTNRSKASFMPARVVKTDFGTLAANDTFTFTDFASEEDYNHEKDMWKQEATLAIKTYEKFVNDGECLFIAIKGQTDPTLWDQTVADPLFAAIQIAKCPIQLLTLMKD